MQAVGPIFLVDDDSRRRAGITHYLASDGAHVEPFESVAELLTHWPTSGVIMVHDDHQSIGLLLGQMAKLGNWMPIVGYTKEPTTAMIVRAILEGAVDYICWPQDIHAMSSALSQVGEKARAVGKAKLKEAIARSQVARLTRREREVLAGVASGCSNKSIGAQLSISARTVEIHRANMLSKLGVDHSTAAIRIAIEASLVK